MTMTIPTSYTETSLAAFMLAELGDVALALDMTLAKLAEPVNDAMLVYGITDIVDATDIDKIRKIARVEAWKAAAKNVAADYAYSEGGASYSRNQMQDMILKQLSLAEQDASGYYAAFQIAVGTVEFPDNPYARLNVSDLGGHAPDDFRIGHDRIGDSIIGWHT
jgi:hypothetical protein